MAGQITPPARLISQSANQYEPSGYDLFDLTAYWQATEQFSVNAGLYNLGDKQYWQ